jgi:hypothetical protein
MLERAGRRSLGSRLTKYWGPSPHKSGLRMTGTGGCRNTAISVYSAEKRLLKCRNSTVKPPALPEDTRRKDAVTEFGFHERCPKIR